MTMDSMDANGNGKRGLPKLREVFYRQRQDSDDGQESSILDFVYDDADTHTNEIAELYSYTEHYELQLNLKAFEDQMEMYNLRPLWQNLSTEQQKSIIHKLLDQLEISNKHTRMKAARCILYIAQGCWAEVQSDKEQQDWSRTNVMLLYETGTFAAFVELLNIEIEDSTAANSAMRKLAVSLADSVDIRLILSVLYIITEIMREESKNLEDSPYKANFETFKEELMNPYGDEFLIIKLLGMVTCFCSGNAPHFPMKKVLLFLWKLILVSLGGIETLRELKKKYREEAGLPVDLEDTIEVTKNMRPSSPPTSAADLLDSQNQKRNNRAFRRSLMKQSSLDEPLMAMEFEGGEGGANAANNEGDGDMVLYMDQSQCQNYYEDPSSLVQPRPSTPQPVKDKGLPWTPKVRQKDVDMFLEGSRLKFVGYKLQGDRESLAGLPQPIHEGVNILKRHMYTSLAEIQIQKEEEIARNPMSTEEPSIRQTPTEILYQAMLPNLPQYMIALLKIVLAAAPTSKAKTCESINIMADVLPEEMPMTVLQSMELGIDVNRHKEIIIKAVSAILLLLLKHFKINHIYQFEFMSQHLVFANCIPLVLKFLNQNILAYIEAKNVISMLDFPMCVIGDQPKITVDDLEIRTTQYYCWRNVFSCINLLRILNKLTKWKHSRVMMLVVFKSAPILKRTLKVMHAMMQLYVLKLLKMQTKYLGRQWRKTNMKTISVIYQKVRHRLNDDWAYGNEKLLRFKNVENQQSRNFIFRIVYNYKLKEEKCKETPKVHPKYFIYDLEAKPWDFQGEECALRNFVDQFNNRRYSTAIRDEDMEPVDTSVTSVLGVNVELTDEFKQHYELWLQQEVFQTNINWDELLEANCEI